MPPAIAHLTKHVPADIDASCLADLVADCRAMCAGALPAVLPAEPVKRVIDLTRSIPSARVPETAKGVVVVIRESVVSLIEGFADYGS